MITENLDTKNTTQKKNASIIKTFSSQEEAEKFRLEKNLQRTDMERFQAMCRMIRIGRMLSSAKINT
ncbi:MAG TPA: hypothetical protein DCQ50_08200 [Chryseobacterium sp.]|nr:hypothetical protein [Chryseobacterium sp.]